MKKSKSESPKATLESVAKSVDDLAIVTKNGFDRVEREMVTKKEFYGFKDDMTGFKDEMSDFKSEMHDFKSETNALLFNIDGKLRTVDQRLDSIEKTLGPLVQISAAMQNELREHNERITKIEYKLGLVKKT
ncbi:MAG: hypothetical protein A3G59_01435 [Candidatus Taylorbacteria bacterium RIFCSPLOWO2_12_FULL_47_20]|uniref:Uncharacterized protein n=2 Tax=Candidatus Tayloriibacteriota TaxID=1817919 RepID=A0A1G2P4V5_9BACT|nr:MAG: hypothetical protein A3H68_02625 [Candidatus Taylorbacteria bacterium RIFCSPLOWO2_02_FULL_46_40]OHA43397.1 MAG: hypothetical protein A3G59_01435 [Candidatus Taylorbacteria bacterium RIFCSPLOWO2_12_FULL_47_20]